MDAHTFFQRIYCVNLDRRSDRWEKFRQQIPDDWPFTSIYRTTAIDGGKVSHPCWWKCGSGAWGCYRSHLQLIEQCLNEGVESVLLLEDDALFCKDFTTRVQEFLSHVPEDWGMLYLGGQHRHADNHPPKKINEHVYQPYSVNRTHAFALRGKTMRAVYKHLCTKDWKNGHHIDHHLERLHQQQKHPIYCPREWLIGQAEGKSNIAGRKFPNRYWPPAQKLADNNPSKEPFVAVIGLHSSGSSCLAGVLYHLGLHMGHAFAKGYWGSHPHYGFEAIGLRDVCERAIPFPSLELKVPRGKAWSSLRRWINEKRRESKDLKTLAGGKYPQLCRLQNQLINICGDNLRIVHINRPLEESIRSLQRRCPNRDPQIIADHQCWLWEGKQDLLTRVPDAHQITVEYADLLQSPEQQINRLVGFLGITPTPKNIARAVQQVNPSKRHIFPKEAPADTPSEAQVSQANKHTESDLSETPTIAPDVREENNRPETPEETTTLQTNKRKGINSDTLERVQEEITCGITAFLRPNALQKLVNSIRKYYPQIRILIADNGDHYANLQENDRLRYGRLPFDCGLSAARNWLVDEFTTEYLLILEEDFFFTPRTRLENYLSVLDADPEVGCVGGALWVNKRFKQYALDLEIKDGVITGQHTQGPWLKTTTGIPYLITDYVFNNFLARRSFLNDHRWTDDLKLREHMDFFLKVQSARKWKAAYTSHFAMLHGQGSKHRRYLGFRRRAYQRYEQILFDTWSAVGINVPFAVSVNPPDPLVSLGRSQAICTRVPKDRLVIGAEVGVFRAANARNILQLCPNIQMLHLIDYWGQHTTEPTFGDDYQTTGDKITSMSQKQWDGIFTSALANVGPDRDRVELHRTTSVEAASHIPDHSLDFVFIDANHSYEGCKSDIAAWSPKVKPGGWIGGHDYDVKEGNGYGVKRAVDELVAERTAPLELDVDTTWFVAL